MPERELDIALDLMWLSLDSWSVARSALEKSNPQRPGWKSATASYVRACDNLLLNWQRLKNAIRAVVRERAINPPNPFVELDREPDNQAGAEAPPSAEQGVIQERTGPPAETGVQSGRVQERVGEDDGTPRR